jgi:hypothetical protein
MIDAHDRDLIQWATEIKIRAERKAGEMLQQMAKHPGNPGPGRGKKAPSSDREGVLTGQDPRTMTTGLDAAHSGKDTYAFLPKKLKDLGIVADQSSDWQKLAAIPESLRQWP